MPGRRLLPHHERFIAQTADRLAGDASVEALIVGGSVAHGLARDDSDLDVMLVVSGAEMERRTAANDLFLFEREEGGVLDGKYVSRAFVEEVAECGSEPARWAFADAIVPFARDPSLEALVRAASAYPEGEREEKLRNFVSHVMLMSWFVRESEKRPDRYLAAWASWRLALYSGRTILAHNRILYPFHKWFTTVLESAPARPPDLLVQIDALLATPTAANAERLAASVIESVEIEIPLTEAVSRFTRLTEWSWRSGRGPLDES